MSFGFTSENVATVTDAARSFRGARSMSVMTAFFGSAGSGSPCALPELARGQGPRVQRCDFQPHDVRLRDRTNPEDEDRR
jgi:hypothetical protein